MDNKIAKLNDILFDELDRLNDDKHMGENFEAEVRRSTAVSRVAQTVLNTAKTNILIMNTAQQNEIEFEDVIEQIGLGDV